MGPVCYIKYKMSSYDGGRFSVKSQKVVWALREVRPTALSVHLQFNPITYSTRMWTDGHHCPITRQLHALDTENDTTTTDSIHL